MKLLLYCTKNKPYLIKCDDWYLDNKRQDYYWKKHQVAPFQYNGKIVAECDYEIEEIKQHLKNYYETKTLCGFSLNQKSCLNMVELDNYLKSNKGYAIHIKNLNIYDKPRGLSDYTYNIKKPNTPIMKGILNNAPQNMMKVYDRGLEKIIISIRPEWLCKILNNEKTIEVRKKVLKEML